MDKRIPALIREAEAQEWTVREVKKGWILNPPDRTLPGVTIHKTPSDQNWYHQAVRRMKKSGFVPTG